jgi:hypothetical protein
LAVERVGLGDLERSFDLFVVSYLLVESVHESERKFNDLLLVDGQDSSMIPGLILALGSALGTNLGFLFKQRGAVLARPIRLRHPARSAV